jgi:hypothetical protein
VADFLACDELCGEAPTAVQCDDGNGPLALEKITEYRRWAYELTWSLYREPFSGTRVGCWRWDDLLNEDAVELLNFASGVPSTRPPVAVRASTDVDGKVHITHYIHSVQVVGECTMWLGMAASWTPITEETFDVPTNLHIAYLLLDHKGLCPAAVEETHAWRREGYLLHPEALEYTVDIEEIMCGVDGRCVEWCRLDYDCPCHHDGRCDPYLCVGDAECECGADHVCIPGCEGDPDCACIADGECNTTCLSLDPDCPCLEDGCCSHECLSQDPDCGCQMDEECRLAPCGWFDPDCRCLADGVCDEGCGDGKDPDCGEDRTAGRIGI